MSGSGESEGELTPDSDTRVDGPDFTWVRLLVVVVVSPIVVGWLGDRFGSSPWLLVAPGVFVFAALLTIPRRAPLRREYLGTQRWVRWLAGLLALAYVATAVRANPERWSSWVLQVALLWGATVLVSWRSFGVGTQLHQPAFALATMLLAVSILVGAVRSIAVGDFWAGVGMFLVGCGTTVDAVSEFRNGTLGVSSRLLNAILAVQAVGAFIAGVAWWVSGDKAIGGIFLGLGTAMGLFLAGRLWGKGDRWVLPALFAALAGGLGYASVRAGFTFIGGGAILALAASAFLVLALSAASGSRTAGWIALGFFELAAIGAVVGLVMRSGIQGVVFIPLPLGVLLFGVGVLRESRRLLLGGSVVLMLDGLASSVAAMPRYGLTLSTLYLWLVVLAVAIAYAERIPQSSVRQRLVRWRRWWTASGNADPKKQTSTGKPGDG